jgi:predicted urease superfamily metal-dependent hydrolase
MNDPIVITVPMERLAEMIETAMIKAHTRQTKPNPEQLFTIYKTAKKLGVAYNSVVRWVAAGRIAATADGKYISQQAIDDFITGKK